MQFSPKSVRNLNHSHLILGAVDLSIHEIQHGTLNVILIGFVDKDVRSSYDNPSFLPSGTAMLEHIQISFASHHRTDWNLFEIWYEILNMLLCLCLLLLLDLLQLLLLNLPFV